MSDPIQNACDTLLMAVVQAQDAEIVERLLDEMGISITRLPSTGAFLGRRNATLLIGIPIENRQAILDNLRENCRQRIEYIAVPIESAPLPLPTPTPVTVGGATVFTIDVERYEEF